MYVSVTDQVDAEPLFCACGRKPVRKQTSRAQQYILVAVSCDHCGILGWRWRIQHLDQEPRPRRLRRPTRASAHRLQAS